MHHDYGMATTRRTFLGDAAALALSGRAETVAKYQSALDVGEFCMVGKFGRRQTKCS